MRTLELTFPVNPTTMTMLDTSTPEASSTDARATAMPNRKLGARLRAYRSRLRALVRHPALHAALAPILIFAALGGISPVGTAPVTTTSDPTGSPMIDLMADRPLHLKPATATPVAAPAELMRPRMADREVFAFAPYWTLDLQNSFDLRHVTTLAYFGVDVARDGSIVRSGNGWVGYQSQDLADLISRAHKAGVRVVLTIKTFDQGTIHALATDPASGAALARNVIAVTTVKNFDGVNIDFEGFGSADRAPFAALARTLSDALHAADPAWQVTLDSYVTSAAVSDGFFDIGAIAPAVDSFFVMGYDMYQRDVASPNAPLPSYQSSIGAYARLAPRSKVVLGAPFYGYDWPTRDSSPHPHAVGSPTPVSYAEIVAAGHPRYWDSTAAVPWTAYQANGRWHEIYYDDASSIALKARLANSEHLRGTGAWALGMNGNDGALVAALLATLTTVVGGPSGPVAVLGPKQASAPAPKSSPRPVASAPPKPKSSSTPTSSPSPTSSPTPTSSPLPIPLPSL
ncbi:MAG: glycosyl hydrolase family 18 protein [Actinomycetota bacterium]